MCDGFPEEWFFPRDKHATKRAKAICSGCPVIVDCRTHGLKHERFGVWGGLAAHELDEMRREQGITVKELVA